MTNYRIYTMSFAKVYPLLVAKVEKKGRTKAEVDDVIRWLTGYSQQELEYQLELKTSYENFLRQAPRLNPSRTRITGTVCGVKIEDIEDPMMREIRYLDKMIDELANGKPVDRVLRS